MDVKINKKFKFSSSIILATFKILITYLWLVATLLVSEYKEHFHRQVLWTELVYRQTCMYVNKMYYDTQYHRDT